MALSDTEIKNLGIYIIRNGFSFKDPDVLPDDVTSDLLKYCFRVIDYSYLYDIESLDEIPGWSILFYPMNITGTELSGHWTLISNMPNYAEFFDSFGMIPDSEFKYSDFTKKNRLVKLLYETSKLKTVRYNNKVLQSKNSDYCGWYCLCRIAYYYLNEYQFANKVPNDSAVVKCLANLVGEEM